MEEMNMLGIIELPDSVFKDNPKSILMMQKKKGKEPFKDFLLVKMPGLTKVDEVNNTIIRVDNWFKNKKWR